MVSLNPQTLFPNIMSYLTKMWIFIYGPAQDKITYIFIMIAIEAIIDIMLSKKRKEKKDDRVFEFIKKLFGYSVFIFMSGAIGVVVNIGENARSMTIVFLFILQFVQILIKLSFLGFDKEVKVMSVLFQKFIKDSAIGKEVTKDLDIEKEAEQYIKEVTEEVAYGIEPENKKIQPKKKPNRKNANKNKKMEGNNNGEKK